ncbi:50S ribosomal protein L18 [archaeon]|nr:MAG: 50S ribosomal protein L18 [archaeon]
MKMSKTFKLQFKRREEGRTDYRNRLRLLRSPNPRLVVRKSLNYITAQVISFTPKGDKTIISATSKELKKLGWTFSTDNIPAAYLTGMLIAKKCKEKNIPTANLDAGLYASTKGNRVYALVKGAVDAGLDVPVSKEIFPSDDRISGKHISSYLEKFKSLPETFESVKGKIGG